MYSKLMRKAPVFLMMMVMVLSMQTFADIVIISHADSGFDRISKVELRKLFLGKLKELPDGSKAKLFEPSESESRSVFLKDVLRKSESNLSAYWARMIFSGKGLPPKSVNVEAQVISLVANTPHAVAYVDSKLLDSSVKVISLY